MGLYDFRRCLFPYLPLQMKLQSTIFQYLGSCLDNCYKSIFPKGSHQYREYMCYDCCVYSIKFWSTTRFLLIHGYTEIIYVPRWVQICNCQGITSFLPSGLPTSINFTCECFGNTMTPSSANNILHWVYQLLYNKICLLTQRSCSDLQV